VAHERIGGRQNAQSYHETRQEEARNAQAAMNCPRGRGDQGGLRDEARGSRWKMPPRAGE